MPREQRHRNLIARMKLVPIHSLIEGKKLLLIDDSIVRGTQMRGIVDFLYACGAKELHVRIACPPVLYGCKYLNFSRSSPEDEPVARQAIRRLEGGDGEARIGEYTDSGSDKYKRMVEEIRGTLRLTSLGYHSLDGLLASIGTDPCRLCTYCWNGKE